MTNREQQLKEALERAKIVAKRLTSLEPENYSENFDGRKVGKKSDLSQPKADSTVSSLFDQTINPSNAGESTGFQDEMLVPAFFTVLLAAHRGDYAKFVENETGAKVISSIGYVSTADEKQIIISGTRREFVDQAKSLIKQELATKQHCIFFIPSNRMGALIGRGGEGIKGLQDRAGCWMFVSQEGNEMSGPEKPVNLFGNQEQVATGKRMINEVVFGAKPGDSVRIFLVPDAACSGLVGKKAENIRYLQQTSNTSIFLDNAIGSEKRRVYISGTLDCIAHAQQLIQEQLGEQIEFVDEQSVSESPLQPVPETTLPAPLPMQPTEPVADASTIAAYYAYYGNLALQYPEYASYYQMIQQQLLLQSQNQPTNPSDDTNTSSQAQPQYSGRSFL